MLGDVSGLETAQIAICPSLHIALERLAMASGVQFWHLHRCLSCVKVHAAVPGNVPHYAAHHPRAQLSVHKASHRQPKPVHASFA